MGLSVSLKLKGYPVENDEIKDSSIDEIKNYYRNYEINRNVYSSNITHNLVSMAKEANVYEALWRPYKLKKEYNPKNKRNNYENKFEESNLILANEIINNLEEGLKNLKSNPKHYSKFNSPNNWGTYTNLVSFIEKYLKACKKHPNAILNISR